MVMKTTARDWFDFVYDSMRAVMNEGHPASIAFYTMRNKEMRNAVRSIFWKFPERVMEMDEASQYVPSAKSFRLEKERVIQESVDEIRETFPDVEAMFYFGRDVGDIDLAGIREYNLLPGSVSQELKIKYPLYDWDCLERLTSFCPYSILEKLTRENFVGQTNITPKIIQQSREVMGNAKLLFGREEDLENLHLAAKYYTPIRRNKI